MHEHHDDDQTRFAAFRQDRRQPTAGNHVDDLSTLADLRDRGLLTADEFDRAKAKALQ